jgi:hypothetical protein
MNDERRKLLEALKQTWMDDPSWDLASTPGFEEHAEELRQFQLEQEIVWKAWQQGELEKFALRISCENLTLAKYIRSLEQRLAALEEKK